MSRGFGASEAIREAFVGLNPLFALVTQLGDVWFLATVALVAFWLGPAAPLGDWDRRRALVLVGIALCAFAATGALKSVFTIPRPPVTVETPAGSGLLARLYESAATASGYGFPSGHAIGSTAVYGTAALLVTRGRRRTRLLVAGLLVAVVSVSRIALGVHYLVDVVAGVLVGLVLVGFARILAERPRGLLELALLLTLAWVAEVGPAGDPLVLLGFTAGLWLAWWRYGPSLVGSRPALRDATVTALAGLTMLGPTLGYATEVATGGVAFGMAAAGGLGVVALPLALDGEKRDEA